MISGLIERIESARVSFEGWLFGFAGVVFIRFFLENFSSPTPSFPAVPDLATLVHYFFFYACALLSLALVIRICIPDILKITKFLLIGLPIIWLPPLFDLFHSGGSGYAMAYIFASGSALWLRFLTLGGSYALGGITPGIKTEVIALVIGVFIYAIIKTKNILCSAGAAVASYIVVFFWLALPSFIKLILDIVSGGSFSVVSPSNFLLSAFSQAHSILFFVRPSEQISYQYGVETVFNVGMSSLYYVLAFALFVAWFAVYRPAAAKAFLKNVRPIRIAYYFSLIIAGLVIAIRYGKGVAFVNWVDGIGLLVLLLSYLCAWLFAVGVNDLADVAIDRVSNKTRPLAAQTLSDAEMRSGNIFFIFCSLLGAYLGGYWTFFMMTVFTAAYYIYSAPPLRLKKIPILATFLISIASLTAIMSGFYFASIDRMIAAFPIRLALLVIVAITLGATIKDIKDIEGDRADGIWTLPVLFGEKAGKMAIATLLAISFLAVPAILGIPSLFIISFGAAAAGYFLVLAKPYREWSIFGLYFLYLIVVAIIL